MEKKTPKDGFYLQKWKIAICNVELKTNELQRLIVEILNYPNLSIADLDLTTDVAGHLDYELAKTELPKIDPRIGVYTPTKNCGTQMVQFKT